MKPLEFYGDSILKGVTYAADAEKYCLCRPCTELFSEQGWDVHNRSHMGATVAKGLSLLTRKKGSQDNGLVLLEYGGNDCDYDWGAVALDPTADHQPHTPAVKFSEQYRQMIKEARNKFSQVAVVSMIPIDAGKYFNWITKDKNAENILRFLGDVTMLSRWQEYYSRLVERIAAEEKCRYIDVRQAFLQSHRFSSLLCVDGIHPTQSGHELLMREICRSITA